MHRAQHPRRLLLSIAVVAAIAVFAAACGSSSGSSSSGASPSSASDVSGSVSVMAVWSGGEQDAFQQVIDGFTAMYPNVTVTYTSAGDQLPTVLSTAVQGGNPPSVAVRCRSPG